MTRARQALAFTAVVFRLLVRDPASAFFMLFLPIVVIVVVGTAFGGQGQLTIGITYEEGGSPAGGTMAADLRDELEGADGVDVEEFDDAEAMRRAIRRFDLSGGVVVPADLDARLARGPETVGLFVLPTGSETFATHAALQSALDTVGSRTTAARLVAESPEVDYAAALETARSLDLAPAVEVVSVDVGDVAQDLSRFALTAPQNLVLFTFINALTASGLLVVARRDAVLRRALAAPVPVGTVIVGLTAGWFILALAQSLLIVGIGAFFFGVDWGDPLAAALLILLFAVVGCGAGLVVGAAARDADRVGSLTPIIGIVLAALGGCMIPVEVFPPTMLAVARIVPHYWAMVGWQNLIFDGGSATDIAGSLAMLAAFGVALVAVASYLLHRDLTGSGRLRPRDPEADPVLSE